MPREKQKVEIAKSIVEVGADLVEDEALPAASEPQSTAQTSLTNVPDPEAAAPNDIAGASSAAQVSVAAPAALEQQKTPVNVLKSTILKALPFVLISLVVFSLPFLASPGLSWLGYAQVRTYMLCALIWNLIGAVLYAQVDKRFHRLLIILVFALPLITSHWWAMLVYMIEITLRSILPS